VIETRKGQAPAQLARAEFRVRFLASYIDPALRAEDGSIARREEIAWHAYIEGRKAPFTQKATCVRYRTDKLLPQNQNPSNDLHRSARSRRDEPAWHVPTELEAKES